jgi:histidine ammonia-lyase
MIDAIEGIRGGGQMGQFTETETSRSRFTPDRDVCFLGEDSLTVEATARFAREPARKTIQLAHSAEERIERSVALKHHLIATHQPIYGVTTGFGDSAIRQISPEKTSALQNNLIVYHLNGSGPVAAPDVVRATMLLRANCLARGYSGVRRCVVQLLIDLLQHDILPVIPERGSVGASGDLVPLCYLASVIKGAGEVVFQGSVRQAQDVLRECSLEPIQLEAKEALGLINGTSFMAGFAALAAFDATELAVVADLCTAFCAEALLGNRGHFDAVVHAQKPHPGQTRSAQNIRNFLSGSSLSLEHAQVLRANPEIRNNGFLKLERSIQDRYSLRCAPHVIGVLYDTLTWVESWLNVEINSTNDNPLFHAESGSVYNGGNFYGGHVGQAMDSLMIAVASLGDLLDRQLALVVDEKFNHGLTPNLIPKFDNLDFEAGLHHGFKGMQIACSSLAAEALKLSNPATVFSRSTEAHNQDKVSMGTIAARDARSVVELVQNIAAIHLMALCQAADLRGIQGLGAGTRAAYELVREWVPFIERDQRLDHYVSALVDMIRARSFSKRISSYLKEHDQTTSS